ncbi:MAG TPA: DUF4097 family beta strand repeat-containing protein [Gemmatimonadaceae bacterium]|nr:DUF4097 family beta strand repeat-containing protein [Gemmatimonadaceae bacterium]
MKTSITLCGLVVAVTLSTAAPSSARAQDEDRLTQIDTTLRLDRGGVVDLSLISGKIRVVGWDRSDVHIKATLESGYLDLSANSSRITLGVDEEGGRRGRHGHGNVGEGNYDVQVPRGTKLVLEAVSGDVSARGSQGEIEATSVSGDAEVSDGTRSVSVESVSGSAHASNVNGSLHIETVSGDLRAETVSGDVQASSVSGTIRLSGIQSRDVRTETVSGDIIYVGTIEPTGRYGFDSHSGTIRLTIPRNAGAQFSLDTFSGDFSIDFPVTVRPRESRGRDDHVEFTIGDGRARVKAETFSGRIVINNGDTTTRREDE